MKKMILVATLGLLSFGVSAQGSSPVQDQLLWGLMIETAQTRGVFGTLRFSEKLVVSKSHRSSINAMIQFPEEAIDEGRVLGRCSVAVRTDRLQVVISAGREFDLVHMEVEETNSHSRTHRFQDKITLRFAGSDGRYAVIYCRLSKGGSVADLKTLLGSYGIELDLTELYELEVFTPEFIQFFAPDTDRPYFDL